MPPVAPRFMQREEVYEWLTQSEVRKRCVRGFSQPLTAKQMARRLDLPQGACSYLFWQLRVYSVLVCLNDHAHCSRLYALTQLGRSIQGQLLGKRPVDPDFDGVDWSLYGRMLFRHREAVIRALIGPMRPSMIKRRARQANLQLAMSVTNVRDTLYYLLALGVVRRVCERGQRYPNYELTPIGRKFRDLMICADMEGPPLSCGT